MPTRPGSISPTLAICTASGLFAVAMLVGATIGNTPLTRPAPAAADTPPPDSAGTPGSDGDSPDSSAGAPAENPTIIIEDFDYVLPEVSAGQTVTVVNKDAALHSATDHGGAFESGLLRQDQSTTITAPAAGSYELFCSLHPSMEVIWEVQP